MQPQEQTHPFDPLTLENGSFIFTPCPGTKDADLTSSVEQLKSAGADAIITLMYDQEMAENNAQQLPQVCQAAGLKWFQLPLPDNDAPNEDFTKAFEKQRADIFAILNNKGTVAVHCKGGSGRTGLVIGLLMKCLGLSEQEVIEKVQTIRPKALQHPAQLSFFKSFPVA